MARQAFPNVLHAAVALGPYPKVGCSYVLNVHFTLLCNALLQVFSPNPDIRQLITVPSHALQQGVALLEQPPKLSIEEPTYS